MTTRLILTNEAVYETKESADQIYKRINYANTKMLSITVFSSNGQEQLIHFNIDHIIAVTNIS